MKLMGWKQKLLDFIYRRYFVHFDLPAKTYPPGLCWDSLTYKRAVRVLKLEINRFKWNGMDTTYSDAVIVMQGVAVSSQGTSSSWGNGWCTQRIEGVCLPWC
jgi:hypothetical protein